MFIKCVECKKMWNNNAKRLVETGFCTCGGRRFIRCYPTVLGWIWLAIQGQCDSVMSWRTVK